MNVTPVKIHERRIVPVYDIYAVTKGLINLLDTENDLAERVQDYL